MNNLEPHGFLSVALNDSFSNICEVIPQAQDIARLGKETQINEVSWKFLDRSLATENGVPSLVGWNILEMFREGTYGKIYKASRMVVTKMPSGSYSVVKEPHDVVVKQTIPPKKTPLLPREDVVAHTSESLLHILAWRIMQQTACPWSIPQPYEVFGDYDQEKAGWRSMYLCMSYVRGKTLFSLLQREWKIETPVENGNLLLEFLANISYILFFLQKKLRLNHRDVKVNNIMIRDRETPFIMEIDDVRCFSTREVTLIDFGFACVGCPPPKAPVTLFQAGSWFSVGELCCKQGRDLAQLLFCIHCYFPLKKYLTPELYSEISKWVQIPWNGGIADGMRGFTKEGKPRKSHSPPEYNTGIYEFLRRVEVDPVLCEPLTVFKRCCSLLYNSS